MNQKIAFYRKYRPNSFNEIIGQKFIIKTLSNAIIKKRQNHAYIFSGPKGVGKTSIAKIFSKALNCLNPQNGDCCNNCQNCNLINENQTIDVIELDAASNNGVNEVRNIIDTMGYLPSVLKYKIYIIDEAHMLSNAAWNAFLKSIEDPPKYLIFIFATTEPYKFPPTITSRCQRYNFLKLNKNELKTCLLNISKKEDIKIDDESLNKIAELADGSVRDACSLLDQLDSYTNSSINSSDIYDVFGLLDTNEKINLLKLIFNNDIENIIKKIEEYEIKGIDFFQLSIDLINILYDKLVYERTKNSALLKFLLVNQINFLEVSVDFIIKCLELWQNNLNQIKTSSNQKFFFQLTCFQSCKLFDFNVSDKTQINNQPKPRPEKNEELNDHKIINTEFEKVKQIKKNNETLENQDKDQLTKTTENNLENQNLNNEKKINIVDSYDFLKIHHISSQKDLKEEFGISKKNNKENIQNKPNLLEEEQIIAPNKPNKTSKKTEKSKVEQVSMFEFNDLQEETENQLDSLKTSEIYEWASNEKQLTDENQELNLNTQVNQNETEFEEKAEVKINSIDNSLSKENIEECFIQIATNANENEKTKVLKFLEDVQTSPPTNKFDYFIREIKKVIVVSNNGIVLLSDNELDISNINESYDSLEFLEYLNKKLQKIYLVIAVSKEQAIKVGEKIRLEKLSTSTTKDVNIDFLNNKIKTKPTAKDLAESMLSDLIIDEEE